MIGGNKALVLTFRGTDNPYKAGYLGEAWDASGAIEQWNAFKPLLDAAFQYAHDNGIKREVSIFERKKSRLV